LAQIQEQLQAQKELSERLKSAEDDATVCSDLELQLDNRHFVKWLSREALEVLVLDASETLRELSSGQYELTVNDKDDLAVVDFSEAGETRAVRTLSGGETFQASLALALALSQQIAAMSALGATLETLLLDEGFGTLDPDALELVAGALARLATGQERTVGVITHVRELAEQVDVQFQVSRDEHGSHVRRIEQEST
jgi:DNA repair protein SbcC/Rad50